VIDSHAFTSEHHPESEKDPQRLRRHLTEEVLHPTASRLRLQVQPTLAIARSLPKHVTAEKGLLLLPQQAARFSRLLKAAAQQPHRFLHLTLRTGDALRQDHEAEGQAGLPRDSPRRPHQEVSAGQQLQFGGQRGQGEPSAQQIAAGQDHEH
jgi:hypothetical protein